MPTPFQHLVYADRVLRHADLPVALRALLKAHLGPFLLGTTSADIQTVTGQARAETHFYRISQGRNGAAAHEMLQRHPVLVDPDQLSPAHAAFITGYLVHLAWDELWAWDIFVPLYRDAGHWPDRMSFFVHHNALRVWLDRTAYGCLQDKGAIAHLLQSTKPDHWLPFAPGSALERWRDWLVCQLDGTTPLQTTRVFAERMGVPVTDLETIVDQMATGRYSTVPVMDAALASYEASALGNSIRTVLKYWMRSREFGGAPASSGEPKLTLAACS